MIKLLRNQEHNFVSGGWVCSNTYRGKLFLKAAWLRSGSANDTFGRCYYEDDLAYTISPRDSIKGIVQKPRSFWAYAGKRGTYSRYECRQKDPDECVFEDA